MEIWRKERGEVDVELEALTAMATAPFPIAGAELKAVQYEAAAAAAEEAPLELADDQLSASLCHVGGVSKVTARRRRRRRFTMELSEPVQSGLQLLADRGCFSSSGAYQALLQAAFRSLLSGQADQAPAFDHPDLEQIDPAVLKYCHAAAATCIVEAGKQKADKSAISTYLEDCKFDRERIEQFCTEYQKNKDNLEILLGSTGRCPPHITDICWRLEYQIKTNQLHKNYRPTYLMTLNIENNDSRSHQDINFSCSMEQLQDLIGKLKDAAKSLERTTQQ